MAFEQPLVTVCVITYNHKRFISEALDSILQQQVTFNWEILVADDFSTDGTREILDTYEKKYPGKVRLILQEKNVGMEQNFRDLFLTPTSKYLAFLDGDDIWISNTRLQKQFDFLEKNPDYVMAYGKSTLMDEAGNSVTYRKQPNYKSGNIFLDVLTCKYLPPMAAALMRNEEIKKMYKTQTEPGVDFYVITSICKSGKVAFMDEIFFCYRMNDQSITSTQSPFIKKLFVNIMESYRAEYPRFVQQGLENGELLLIYHYAEKNPGVKNLILLLKKFRFSALYWRQLAKLLINILKVKLKPA